MGSVLSLVLAITLGAEPPQVDRPARTPVKVLAFVGTGFLTLGLAFEITGRAGADPRAPVLEWSAHAQANTVGGLALMGGGLCLLSIAALLTPWHFPSLAVWATPGGAMVGLGARWP